MAVFRIYKDKRREYRWRLRAVNGRIVADSGEGYTAWQGVMDAINWVKRYAPGADVEDLTKRMTLDLLSQILKAES